MNTVALRTEALPSQADVMVQAKAENFTVANAILGPARRHLMAIYGFARLVDDIGDEVSGDRLEMLDAVEGELHGIYRGERPRHRVMVTLADTIRACHLPVGPFVRLIDANRRDQVCTRYETFDQLLAYCQLSAAPVGELVLHVFEAATSERIALSDRICAGLQVVEHVQDISEDYARGRVYMPREDMIRFGCEEADLSAPLQSAAGRALIAFESRRARALLSGGAPLAKTLALRQRVAVAGFVAGGRAALDALEHGEARPRLRFAMQFARAVSGR
jgi:squalene synthase HpnC